MNTLFIANLLFSIGAFCVLVSKRNWFLATVALLSMLIYGYGLFVHGVPSDDTLKYMLYCEERYTPEKAMASSYGAIVSLIMTSLMMSTYPWLKRWALFIWFALLMIIGVITGIMSPLGAFEGLYGTCCAIMTFLAQMLGLSYLEVCCLENIYIHSLLPTLFAIPAVYTGSKNLLRGHRKSTLAAGISFLNFTMCFVFTAFIWNHYIHLSMQKAAQLCVEELQFLGRMLLCKGWAGYVCANMLIFVGAFLLSAFISWLLYRWTKQYDKE